MIKKKAFVYILLCENGSFYTGYTTDLEKRFKAHQDGKVKYTRAFKAVKMLQYWEFDSKSEAMKAEYFIKQQSRKKKEEFIQNPSLLAEIR